jgi:hypothetical protein
VLKDTEVGVVGAPPDYCGKRHAKRGFICPLVLVEQAWMPRLGAPGDALATCP